ncbi:hypothetical protein [Ralstonia pseudosolanacearum]|uniref:hypothetical protein n=1 Tax=Ralstonia pseudosolanacearum TaxID=1310165 RepID=UPI00399D6986
MTANASKRPALALELGVHSYHHARDILINNRDGAATATPADWISPSQAHVRGPSYYQQRELATMMQRTLTQLRALKQEGFAVRHHVGR